MDPWLQRWNDRYSQKEYAFGTEPNEFLKAKIDQFQPGAILFAAEGEGRNAVYAASKGWTVSAFDISVEGKNKAIKLAEANHVTIDYHVGELPDLDFEENQFDAISLIYAHFPASIKSDYHQRLSRLLKPGGLVIVEAFGKNHLPYRERNPAIGGPNNLEQLFSAEELLSDFHGYEVLELTEGEIELKEGPFHSGIGYVIRYVSRKL